MDDATTRFTMQLLRSEDRGGVLVLDAVAAEEGPGGLPPGTPFTLAFRHGGDGGGGVRFDRWADGCQVVSVSGASHEGAPGLAFRCGDEEVVLVDVGFTSPPPPESPSQRRTRFPWSK